MKYNDTLCLRDNESHTMLLRYIKEGSSVLEFGCANGIMTKYMKEELHCDVYIVEYEKEAYDDAIKYAVDGLCTDIMEYKWCNSFDRKFDFIIFADVLEHLIDPKSVLEKTKELLSENGKVLISIPNIAHNDIIRKLLYNHFDYTDIGLLDNTHIRFFSINNLKDFVHSAGFKIQDLKYVTVPNWQTEQYRNQRVPIDNCVENMLYERNFGTVYQFIMVLNNDCEECICEEPIKESRYVKLYYNRGDGYTEQDTQLIKADNINDNVYKIEYKISNDKLHDICEIRIDPLEEQNCIITKCVLLIDDKCVMPKYSSCVTLKDKVCVFGNDPMIFFEIKDTFNEVAFLLEFMVEGQSFINELIHGLDYKHRECLKMQQESIDNVGRELLIIEKQTDTIEEQRKIIEELRTLIEQKMKDCDDKDKIIEEKNITIEDKENSIKKYAIQLKNTEEVMEEQRKQNQLEVLKIEQQNKQLLEQLTMIKSNYDHILNTNSWKITAPLRAIYKKWNK